MYREDWVLEAAAVWEAVGQLSPELEFFGPIAHYSGFAQEIQWLIRQIDYGELKWDALPAGARTEVERLHHSYHTLLKEYGVLTAPPDSHSDSDSAAGAGNGIPPGFQPD